MAGIISDIWRQSSAGNLMEARPYRNIAAAIKSFGAVWLMAFILFCAWGPTPGPWAFREGDSPSFLSHVKYFLISPIDMLAVAFSGGRGLAAIWFCTKMLFLPALPAVLIAAYVGRTINPEIYLSGRKLLRGKDSSRYLRESSKRYAKVSGDGIQVLPDWTWSRAQEVQSFVVMGNQGSGKTQVLLNIMLPAIERGDKTIFFDIAKPEFTSLLPKDVHGNEPILLAPWDRRSVIWDIARDINDLAAAEDFASGIISVSEKDPIWGQSARALLIGILLYLIRAQENKWGWADLSEMAGKSLAELKELIYPIYPPARDVLEDPESKTATSIKINFSAELRPIYILGLFWGEREKVSKYKISLRAWFTNDLVARRTLIIQGNGQMKNLSAGMARAITNLFSGVVKSPSFLPSKSRRIWLIHDEIPQFGRLENVKDYMAIGRSRGVCVCFGLQSLAQVREIYSANEIDAWMSLFPLKFFCGAADRDSQDYISALLGKYRYQIRQKNINSRGQTGSTSLTAPTERQVMTPDQIEADLGPGDNGITALVVGQRMLASRQGENARSDALLVSFPFSSLIDIREGHSPMSKAERKRIGLGFATLKEMENAKTDIQHNEKEHQNAPSPLISTGEIVTEMVQHDTENHPLTKDSFGNDQTAEVSVNATVPHELGHVIPGADIAIHVLEMMNSLNDSPQIDTSKEIETSCKETPQTSAIEPVEKAKRQRAVRARSHEAQP